MTSVSRLWCVAVIICLMGTVGCGGSTPSTPVAENQAAAPGEGLPTLAIPGVKPTAAKPAPGTGGKPVATQPGTRTATGTAPAKGPAAPAGDIAVKKEPVKNSPEWLLLEIQRIKVMPLPGSEKNTQKSEAEDDLDNEKPLTAAEEQQLKDEFEKTKVVRRERNLQVIGLAEDCIRKTAKQPDQEAEFDAAVHYLLDARLQLALQGDTASIEALYDAARTFYERKPQSASAVEAQLTLVNLTHANALRYGQTEPKWIQEFAKHSQLYATRFTDEEARAVSLLSAAARSCELAGLTDDAKNCYSLLITKFKDTPQAQQALGVVRRFQLKGKTLELTGPTMDGDDLTIETYRGKMVIVVFWATHAKPFVQQLPKLTATMKKYEKYATTIGVNLDADEGMVESFLEQTGITWPQIFSPNRALRGWNSPLAVHYGINNLPTIWLVDPNGVVTDTAIDAENLESRLREVYLPFLKSTQGVKPAGGTR
ncbi:MAG: redoxin domain-containing protein [Planctomycetes bacterium]|nr:redoxin domain-containing protein [Planctomycetota bacterium]